MFGSARRIDPGDRAASRELLAQVYGSLSWRVPELLAGYLAADDIYFDAVCPVRTPTWSRGPVALLGGRGLMCLAVRQGLHCGHRRRADACAVTRHAQ